MSDKLLHRAGNVRAERTQESGVRAGSVLSEDVQAERMQAFDGCADERHMNERCVEERRVAVCGTCLHYALFCESGVDRAEFGTACARIYTLTVSATAGSCERTVRLFDIARDELHGRRVLALFADGAVTPDEAYEVMDALLG